MTLFVTLTNSHPILMGFIKFFILATFGELLGRKIATKKWQLSGIAIEQRALIWGLFGVSFSFVFPIFSFGVDGLIRIGLLPIFSDGIFQTLSVSFWKSFWINLIFAFPFMTLHRITDTLIDQRGLFKRWPFLKIWKALDWDSMWKGVAPTILWFWLPAHTITFSLPNEFRILVAALLGVILGVILSILKQKSNN